VRDTPPPNKEIRYVIRLNPNHHEINECIISLPDADKHRRTFVKDHFKS